MRSGKTLSNEPNALIAHSDEEAESEDEADGLA